MKLWERLQQWRSPESPESEASLRPLREDEDPFEGPVALEIRDEIDLHAIPPRQVKAVVEEYLREARARGFRVVRIIHGKGIGVQREIVHALLSRTPFVRAYRDAPGLGSTLADLDEED